MAEYDVIIIGGGGFGSSAAFHAARGGKRVLVLDQFERNHNRGSSHGESRIIRKAYFEHSDYVPLLQQSYKLWAKLEEVSQRSLLSPCGLMLSGPPSGTAVPGTKRAAAEYGLDLEEVLESEFEDRFPGFSIPPDFEVVYEVDGGLLHVEDCVDTYLTLAERRGVDFLWETAATHWESSGSSVKVWTKDATYEGRSLVITSGAWAQRMLSSLPGLPPLKVLRKVMFWFPVTSASYDFSFGGSGFFFEMPYGEFYGFPSLDGETIKVCQHSDGNVVDDPTNLDRDLRAEDLAPVAQFIADVLPEVTPEPVLASVCMYTMSPDGHFIVDRHPEFSNVCFGAGFSGHGFKFVPVLGKALADFAVNDGTDLPIQFLGLQRFLE